MADRGGQSGPVQVNVELSPESLQLIRKMAKEAEPTLRREVNASLRKAGDVAAQAARDAVTGTTPPKADNRSKVAKLLRHAGTSDKARGNGTMRAAIAKGVRVTVRMKGIRVVSTDKYLPENKKAMNRVYRLSTFRHPVFGEDKWVNQHGKDWFYGPVKNKKPEFESAVLAALEAAATKLGDTK